MSRQPTTEPGATIPETHRRIVDDFYRALFEQHDAARAAQVYTDDAVLLESGAPGPIQGRKAIEEYIGALLRAFPDFSARIDNVFGTGDWFAAELSVRGTHTGPLEFAPGNVVPATNKRLEMPVCWLGRVSREGLCVEDHTYYDVASMMEQLGLAG
jgi:predicted SnoaL-like aldol condensation-catalyzing enzyme